MNRFNSTLTKVGGHFAATQCFITAMVDTTQSLERIDIEMVFLGVLLKDYFQYKRIVAYILSQCQNTVLR